METVSKLISYSLVLVCSIEYLTNITQIETEGVQDVTTNFWVESYYVSTSNSSEAITFQNYTEGQTTRIVSKPLSLGIESDKVL